MKLLPNTLSLCSPNINAKDPLFALLPFLTHMGFIKFALAFTYQALKLYLPTFLSCFINEPTYMC